MLKTFLKIVILVTSYWVLIFWSCELKRLGLQLWHKSDWVCSGIWLGTETPPPITVMCEQDTEGTGLLAHGYWPAHFDMAELQLQKGDPGSLIAPMLWGFVSFCNRLFFVFLLYLFLTVSLLSFILILEAEHRLKFLCSIRSVAWEVIGPRGQSTIIVLNGHTSKLTPRALLSELHLLTLIKEASIWSRWWLIQRPTTGQGTEENKKLKNAQPWMEHLDHTLFSQGPQIFVEEQAERLCELWTRGGPWLQG